MGVEHRPLEVSVNFVKASDTKITGILMFHGCLSLCWCWLLCPFRLWQPVSCVMLVLAPPPPYRLLTTLLPLTAFSDPPISNPSDSSPQTPRLTCTADSILSSHIFLFLVILLPTPLPSWGALRRSYMPIADVSVSTATVWQTGHQTMSQSLP